MADILRCDAALEETVAHFIPSCHIREADGEIGLDVMDEVQFFTFQPRQVGVYASFLQIAENAGWVSSSTSNCWKLGSDACWQKEKDTGRMCGTRSAILLSK